MYKSFFFFLDKVLLIYITTKVSSHKYSIPTDRQPINSLEKKSAIPIQFLILTKGIFYSNLKPTFTENEKTCTK